MKKRNAITGYFLIAPYIIGMLIFYLVPYIISIALSFTTGVGQRSFAGLSNYISLFQSKAFLLASGNWDAPTNWSNNKVSKFIYSR